MNRLDKAINLINEAQSEIDFLAESYHEAIINFEKDVNKWKNEDLDIENFFNMLDDWIYELKNIK
jgi:hypothetical protein